MLIRDKRVRKLAQLMTLEHRRRQVEQAAQEANVGKPWLGKRYIAYTGVELVCPACKEVVQTNLTYILDKDNGYVLRAFAGQRELEFSTRETWKYVHPHVYDNRSICMGYDDKGNRNTSIEAALFLGLNPASALVDVGLWFRDVAQHECLLFESQRSEIERIKLFREGLKATDEDQLEFNSRYELAPKSRRNTLELKMPGTMVQLLPDLLTPPRVTEYNALRHGHLIEDVGVVGYYYGDGTIQVWFPGRNVTAEFSTNKLTKVQLKPGMEIFRPANTRFWVGDKVRLKAEYRRSIDPKPLKYGWPSGVTRDLEMTVVHPQNNRITATSEELTRGNNVLTFESRELEHVPTEVTEVNDGQQ